MKPDYFCIRILLYYIFPVFPFNEPVRNPHDIIKHPCFFLVRHKNQDMIGLSCSALAIDWDLKRTSLPLG